MDPDDFDQTQAIALDDQDFNDDTDDLAPDGDKKPVSFLKVLLQQGVSEATHALYEGDNIVGRNQDTCHVHIPSKSLSKEHACIQVVGDVHMIFDKGSRNKTRRGKLFLSPEVRYELKNNEEVVFADVKCVYQIANELDTVGESGSDTEGSESLMLKYDVTGDTSSEAVGGKVNRSGESETGSHDDDSVLPPTQSYPADHSNSRVIAKNTPESAKPPLKSLDSHVPLPTLVLSESESGGEEEEVAQVSGAKSKLSSKKGLDVQETLLCEDSDQESSRDKYQFMAATQAYGIGGNDADDTEDDVSRHSLIGAATQAYGMAKDGNEDDHKLLSEPTQAFAKISDTSSDVSGTQSFRITPKVLEKGKEKQAHAELNASDSSAAATQVFEEEEEDDGEVNNAGLFAAATMACDDIVDEDEDTDDEDEDTKSHTWGLEEATQVFDPNGPTQKVSFKKDENENSEIVKVDEISKSGKVVQSGTLIINDTSDSDTLPVPHDKKVTPGPSKTPKSKVKGNQALQGHAVSARLSSPVNPADGDTLQVSDEEEVKPDHEQETQVFGEETMPVEILGAKNKPGKRQPLRKVGRKGDEAELETVPIQDSVASVSKKGFTSTALKTVQKKKLELQINPVSDTLVIVEGKNCEGLLDEPTQLFDWNNITGNGEAERDEGTVAATSEPTQDFVTSSSDLPTQVFAPEEETASVAKGNKTKLLASKKEVINKAVRSTLAISSDEDDEDDDEDNGEKPWMASAAGEATQAYGDRGEDEAAVEEATQAYCLDEEDDDKEDNEEVDKAGRAEEATQAYGLVTGEDAVDDVDDEDDEEVEKAGCTEEATQAYGLVTGGDVDDEDATQEFDNFVEDADGDGGEVDTGDPTQKYEMSVAPLQQEGKGEETVEDSEDDSDLEETSVLKMDQVVEALAEPDTLLSAASDTGEKAELESSKPSVPLAAGQQSADAKMGDAEILQGLSDPPLSPEIPDKSAESTPIFAVPPGEKELSDTEEMVLDSMALGEEEVKAETAIPIPQPSRSPLKSALATKRRSPSPVSKRVNFKGLELETPEKNQAEKETKPLSRRGREKKGQTMGGAAAKGGQRKDVEIKAAVKVSSTEGNQKEEEQGNGLTADQAKASVPGGSGKDPCLSPSKILRGKMKVVESLEASKSPAQASPNANKAKNVNPQSEKLDVKSTPKKGHVVKGENEKKDNKQKVEPISVEDTDKLSGSEPSGNNMVDPTDEKITPRGLKGKAQVPTQKSGNSSEDLNALTSASEGRVSSRGRRITKSNLLKDYDTSTRGKTGKSPQLAPSPRPEAGTSGDTVSHAKIKPVENVVKQAESPLPPSTEGKQQQDSKSEKSGESKEPAASTAVTKRIGRGRRQAQPKVPPATEEKQAESPLPPPPTEEKQQIDTNSEKSGKSEKPATITVVAKQSGRGRRQAQSNVPQAAEEKPVDEGKPAASSFVMKGSGRGRRGAGTEVKEKDKPQKVNAQPNTDTGQEVSSGKRGKKTITAVEQQGGQSSTADSESVKKDHEDADSVVSETDIAGSRQVNTRKTRGQVTAMVTDGKGSSVKGKEEDEELSTENVSALRKRGRGRKSAAVLELEDQVVTKKSKRAEESQSVKETAEINEEEAEGTVRIQRNSRKKTILWEQFEQKITSIEAKQDTPATENKTSKRGRLSHIGAAWSKATEDFAPGLSTVSSGSEANDFEEPASGVARKTSQSRNRQNVLETVLQPPTQNITATSSTNDTNTRSRGGKGRRSTVAPPDSSAITSDREDARKQSDARQPKDGRFTNEGKPQSVGLESSAGQSRRQRSKAGSAANTGTTPAQDKMDISDSEQDSPSSAGTRGRRGGKRAAASQESATEEDSKSSTRSTGKGAGQEVGKKSTVNNTMAVTSSQPEKKGRTSQSQLPPSPAKRSRRSSPAPSTPSTPARKSSAVAAAASPVSSPSLRKSTLNHQPKVMFTGVIDDQGEKIVKDLGAELASNIQDCTHLITDKVRRTVKFLGGLAKGALIVTPQWLESSKHAKTFLDGHKFLVNDPAMEKQYRFSLRSSIERASSKSLLQGYTVHVTPSVRPDPSQMKDILDCAGAKYLGTMPTKPQPQTMVISCPEDQSLWTSAAKAGVPVVGAEFILTGILRQELQPQAFSLVQADTVATGKGKGRHK